MKQVQGRAGWSVFLMRSFTDWQKQNRETMCCLEKAIHPFYYWAATLEWHHAATPGLIHFIQPRRLPLYRKEEDVLGNRKQVNTVHIVIKSNFNYSEFDNWFLLQNLLWSQFTWFAPIQHFPLTLSEQQHLWRDQHHETLPETCRASLTKHQRKVLTRCFKKKKELSCALTAAVRSHHMLLLPFFYVRKCNLNV